jgi:hypothetical protein
MGGEVSGEDFGYDCQVKQIHGIGDETYVCEEPDQDLWTFADAFKFRKHEKAEKTFDKDPEDLCKKDIGRPDHIDDDIRSHYTHDEADVPYFMPEEGVPAMNEGGEDAQRDTIQPEYYYFLDLCSEIIFIDGNPRGDEYP